MSKVNRQRSSRNQQRTANRNRRKSDAKYWIIGSVVAVLLLSIYLFSRNEHKDRLMANRQAATVSHPATGSSEDEPVRLVKGPRTLRMRKGDGGVYYVPMRINGQELEFVFDTGASSIQISQLEANLLMKQGKISSEDIEGISELTIADGSSVSALCINLREVELAGVKLYNVKAFVGENMEAPLLLGQTVMSRFGSFKVDYKNETITFE